MGAVAIGDNHVDVVRLLLLQLFKPKIVVFGYYLDRVACFVIHYFYFPLNHEVYAYELLPLPVHCPVEGIVFNDALTQHGKSVRNPQFFEDWHLNIENISEYLIHFFVQAIKPHFLTQPTNALINHIACIAFINRPVRDIYKVVMVQIFGQHFYYVRGQDLFQVRVLHSPDDLLKVLQLFDVVKFRCLLNIDCLRTTDFQHLFYYSSKNIDIIGKLLSK